jgi:hypothetical protein
VYHSGDYHVAIFQSHARSLTVSGRSNHDVVSIRASWAVEFPQTAELVRLSWAAPHLEGTFVQRRAPHFAQGHAHMRHFFDRPGSRIATLDHDRYTSQTFSTPRLSQKKVSRLNAGLDLCRGCSKIAASRKFNPPKIAWNHLLNRELESTQISLSRNPRSDISYT